MEKIDYLSSRLKSVAFSPGRTFNVVVVILAGVLFSACGANWHLRKAIQKGAKVQVDTVLQEIPVILPQIKHDTAFVDHPGDTVVLTKDRLKVTYVRIPGDTVFLSGECEADTIYKEVPTIVTQTISAPARVPWWIWLIISGLGLAVLGLIFRVR